MLFRKISNFTPVATAQDNALEKLFQLAVPRLIFQNKILLTEVLVGSSSLIPEPVCTCVHPEPSQANKNPIPEVYLHNYLNYPCKMPHRERANWTFPKQSSPSSLCSAKGRDKHMTNIFKRARGYQLQLISMNILHHPSGLPRTNTN